MYILAVLELDKEKEAAGEALQNGGLKVDIQTQMTSFEIDLKDRRFVAAIIKAQTGYRNSSALALIYICWTLNI